MQCLEHPIEQVDPALRRDPQSLNLRLFGAAFVGVVIAVVMMAV
jgi:hypothetical protein